MGIYDYILVGIIVVCMIVAFAYMIHRRKSGKCIGCSGDCAGCIDKNSKV